MVEAHSEAELECALDDGVIIVGINNRDLASMKVELGTTIGLCELIPRNRILVTESGIKTPDDIKKLKEECKRKPDYYLVGTALMKAKDRWQALRSLINA